MCSRWLAAFSPLPFYVADLTFLTERNRFRAACKLLPISPLPCLSTLTVPPPLNPRSFFPSRARDLYRSFLFRTVPTSSSSTRRLSFLAFLSRVSFSLPSRFEYRTLKKPRNVPSVNAALWAAVAVFSLPAVPLHFTRFSPRSLSSLVRAHLSHVCVCVCINFNSLGATTMILAIIQRDVLFYAVVPLLFLPPTLCLSVCLSRS